MKINNINTGYNRQSFNANFVIRPIIENEEVKTMLEAKQAKDSQDKTTATQELTKEALENTPSKLYSIAVTKSYMHDNPCLMQSFPIKDTIELHLKIVPAKKMLDDGKFEKTVQVDPRLYYFCEDRGSIQQEYIDKKYNKGKDGIELAKTPNKIEDILKKIAGYIRIFYDEYELLEKMIPPLGDEDFEDDEEDFYFPL